MIEAGHAMQPDRDTRNVRRLQRCEQTASAHQLESDVLRNRLDEAPAAYRAQLGEIVDEIARCASCRYGAIQRCNNAEAALQNLPLP